MKLAIFGAKGFVGSHFHAHYPDALVTHRLSEANYLQFDLSTYHKVEFSLEGITHAAICAGVFNPVVCEQEAERTRFINVEQTAKLAQELIGRGIVPILFSTDYIFDDEGNKQPLNGYGRQKLALEEALKHTRCLIARCTKIYGSRRGDGTLFDAMAVQLIESKSCRAATDQLFAPIHVDDLIDGIEHLIASEHFGIVDFASEECVSRYEMATWIAENIGGQVEPIALDDLGDHIRRPKQSSLKPFSALRSWKKGAESTLRNYCSRV